MHITFRRLTTADLDLVFRWIAEPHMQATWDRSDEHRQDIINFAHGHPQHYFAGTTKYWIGYYQEEPFAFILSDALEPHQKDLPELHRQHLSATGRTITLDFAIGNPAFLGKGLAAPTLEAFVQLYHQKVDQQADTFVIDPDTHNAKALHVYQKSGFEKVGEYEVTEGAFIGHRNCLMIKRIKEPHQ